MSRSRGIYCAFGDHYINVREEFDHYKYIISFNSKIKNKRFHRKKKRRINWHGVKGERDPSSVQRVLN